MYNVHGISVTGGTFPATIWRRFMEPAMQSGLVKHRPWFTVLGTEMWLPFTSTWEKDPTLDVSLGSNPAYLPAAAKAKAGCRESYQSSRHQAGDAHTSADNTGSDYPSAGDANPGGTHTWRLGLD